MATTFRKMKEQSKIKQEGINNIQKNRSLATILYLCLAPFLVFNWMQLAAHSVAEISFHDRSLSRSNDWRVRREDMAPSIGFEDDSKIKIQDNEEQASDSKKRITTTNEDIGRRVGANNSKELLPQWLQEYFVWHQDQLNQLSETNWDKQRYFVARCLKSDLSCGGASDRLQGIPTLLRIASMTRRIFFIKWNHPFALEEFLVPPTGGLNWTIPEWLDDQFNYTQAPVVRGTGKRKLKSTTREDVLVTSVFQAPDYGATYYDENRVSEAEPSFSSIYSELWSRVFVPSKPVADLVSAEKKLLQLKDGQYAAVHVRSKYRHDKSRFRPIVHKALDCVPLTKARKHGEALPVYFASDSIGSTNEALEYGKKKHTAVVARDMTKAKEPLHLDKGADYFSRFVLDHQEDLHASDYYDIFIDLYMLAGAQCVSYGNGGFGRWAALISHGVDCHVKYLQQDCNFT